MSAYLTQKLLVESLESQLERERKKLASIPQFPIETQLFLPISDDGINSVIDTYRLTNGAERFRKAMKNFKLTVKLYDDGSMRVFKINHVHLHNTDVTL